jgi:hypothetical protein
MTKLAVFIQVQGKPGIAEAEIPLPTKVDDLHEALKALGIEIDDVSEIFIDEAEEAESKDRKSLIAGLKQGTRVHVTRCKKITVTVHFLDKTVDRRFAPGKRVRGVKKWAVEHFGINPTDAGEHIMQLCNTTTQPPTDTPLAEIANGHECLICFDLVPEKRVEG